MTAICDLVAEVAVIIVDSQPWPALMGLVAGWVKTGNGCQRACGLRMLGVMGEYMSSQVEENQGVSNDLLHTLIACLGDGGEGGGVRAAASSAACQMLQYLPSSRWEDWAEIWPALLRAVMESLQAAQGQSQGALVARDILEGMADTVGLEVRTPPNFSH